MMPFLTSKSSYIYVSEQQGTWIISIFSIGDLVGGLLNLLIIDRLGRKYTILTSVILGLIDWIIIIMADSYIHLCMAKVIGGIGQGIIANSSVVYLAEISGENIRVIFMNFMKI